MQRMDIAAVSELDGAAGGRPNIESKGERANRLKKRHHMWRRRRRRGGVSGVFRSLERGRRTEGEW